MESHSNPVANHHHGPDDENPSETASASNEASNPNSRGAETRRGYEKKHPLDIWIFAFLVFTFLATTLAAYFTGRQWLTAEDTERRTLRAYVSAEIEKYPDFMHDNWEMVIVYQNHGQTPAFKISTWVQTILGQNPLPSDLIKKTETARRDLSVQDVTLFPGSKFRTATLNDADESRSVPFLTDDEKAAIRAGWKTMWLFGEVRYVDVFDKPHITHFRLFMTGEFMTRANKLFWASEGNAAD